MSYIVLYTLDTLLDMVHSLIHSGHPTRSDSAVNLVTFHLSICHLKMVSTPKIVQICSVLFKRKCSF